MTERTLREKIEALLLRPQDNQGRRMHNNGIRKALAVLDAHPAPAVPDDVAKLWQDTADNDDFCQLLGLIPLRDVSTNEAIMWREKDGDFMDFAVAIKEFIEAQAAELARLRAEMFRQNRLHELNAEALAEIRATVDGKSEQPIKDIIYGLLDEINNLTPPDETAV